MESLTIISYVALGIDVLLIIIAGGFVVYFFSYWNDLEGKTKEISKEIENSKPEDLKSYYLKLIENSGKSEQYYGYYGLAKLYAKEKDFEKAEEYAIKAIELVPSEGYAYDALIDILFYKKNFYKACSFIFQASEKNYFTFNLSVSAGKYFLYTNNYDEAIRILSLANARDNSAPLPLILLAFAYYLNNNKSKAIDYIREARKKILSSVEEHNQFNEWAKGLLALISGDIKEARYIFEYYRENISYGPLFELILDKMNNVVRIR